MNNSNLQNQPLQFPIDETNTIVTPIRSNMITTGELIIQYNEDGSIMRQMVHSLWPTYCFDGQPLFNAPAQISYNLQMADQMKYLPRVRALDLIK